MKLKPFSLIQLFWINQGMWEVLRYSLVVSCKGEKDTIKKFLESISIQTASPSEVVICDAGEDREVEESINNWANLNKDIKVDYFRFKDSNIAQARNAGVKRATSEIILFADLGTRLDFCWAKLLLLPFLEGGIDCCMGWYQMVGEKLWQNNLRKLILPEINSENLSKFLPSARSLAIKRHSFLDCGGFNESLSLAAEDSLFGFQMKKLGIKLGFSPDAIVYWDFPESPVAMWNKLFNYSKGDAETGFLFWGHYFKLSEFLIKLLFDLAASYFLAIIFSKIFGVPFIFSLLFVLVGFPFRRMFNYLNSYGRFDGDIWERMTKYFVLILLLSSQVCGFLRGLFNLRRSRNLRELFERN